MHYVWQKYMPENIEILICSITGVTVYRLDSRGSVPDRIGIFLLPPCPEGL
jgi:hypothetical protein